MRANAIGNVRVAFGAVMCVAVVVLMHPETVYGQAGFREALERLDSNENGYVDPDEITSLSRPYLERISSRSRASVDRPTEIGVWQEAARIYHAFQNGVGGFRVQPDDPRRVKPFGLDDDEPQVPGFGVGKIKYPYTEDDLDEADRTLYYYDRNKDGGLDARESRRVRWTHRDPFDDDLNGDGKLNRLELAQRYARRRLVQDDAGELFRQAWRQGRLGGRDERPEREDSSRWWREGGNAYWLTAAMMSRFDNNKNGRLEADEARQLAIPVGQLDADKDNVVSRDELFAYTKQVQDEAGDESGGLPGWFFERDIDEDGQVALHEYATDWSPEQLDEFTSFDLNDDGLLTATEVQRAKAAVGGTYRSEKAEILPPRRTIISEIEVNDDFVIADIDVQLSLTHTNVGDLDGYLDGPDGTRVELFTAIGGSGDNFERTTFDDEASGQPIYKSRPPYEGRYRPEEKDRGKPSLGGFEGKSAKGVWQLVIRATRSDRFGMLHGWGLQVRPAEDLPSVTGVKPEPGTRPEEPSDEEDTKKEAEKPSKRSNDSGGESFDPKKIDWSDPAVRNDPEIRRKMEEWKKSRFRSSRGRE